MSLRSKCHARFMVSIVQCLRGLPTRFLVAMLGCALPMKVACLVGAIVGSLSVCISSLCWDAFICVDTFFLFVFVWLLVGVLPVF